MTHPTLFDAPTPAQDAPSRTFAVGQVVWVIVDADVLPARVVRCYFETSNPFMAGERVVVRWPEPERPAPYDTFSSLVFAESDWKAAKAKAAE